MNLNEHARHLGGLLANLQSLELLIRVYLSKQPGARSIGPVGTDIFSHPVGTIVPESDMTSYDSLTQLITKFNLSMEQQGKPIIDTSLIALRDALAHGRISADLADENLRLVKYDKPINGNVRVSFNAQMTEHWFSSNKVRVLEAMALVHAEMQP